MPGKFRKIYEKHIFAIGLHIPLSLSPLVPIVAQAHAPYLLPLLLLLLPSKSIHAFLLPTSLPGHHCFPSITALCATPLSKLPSVGPSFYDDVRKQGELLMLSLSPFIPLLFLVSFPPSLPDPNPNPNPSTPKTAIDAVQAGLKDGLEQLEIEFPISPGRIDVSLGEFLDDSREWTREFVRPFTPKGSKLWVIFPDGKEATLANERWGGVNFRIMGIETAMKMPKEEVCELQVLCSGKWGG
jgi:hypothetical protein